MAAGTTSTIDTTIGDEDTLNYLGDSCTSFEYIARNKGKKSLGKGLNSQNDHGKTGNGKLQSVKSNIPTKITTNGTGGRYKRKLPSLERKQKDKWSSSRENSLDKDRSPKKEKMSNLDVGERSPSLELEETRSRSASSGKSSKKDNSSQTEKRDLKEMEKILLDHREEEEDVKNQAEDNNILGEQNLLKNMKEKTDCKKDIMSLEELKNVNDALIELGQENLLTSARDLTPLVLGRCVSLSPKPPVSLSDILKSSFERRNKKFEDQISKESGIYGKIKNVNLERKSSFTFKNKLEPVQVKKGSNSADRKRKDKSVDRSDDYQNLKTEELELLLVNCDRNQKSGKRSPGVDKKLTRFLTIERKAAEQEQKLLASSPEISSPFTNRKILSRENSLNRKKERPVGFHEEQLLKKFQSADTFERKDSFKGRNKSNAENKTKNEENATDGRDKSGESTLVSTKKGKDKNNVKLPVSALMMTTATSFPLNKEFSSEEDLKSPISVKEFSTCFARASQIGGCVLPQKQTKEKKPDAKER